MYYYTSIKRHALALALSFFGGGAMGIWGADAQGGQMDFRLFIGDKACGEGSLSYEKEKDTIHQALQGLHSTFIAYPEVKSGFSFKKASCCFKAQVTHYARLIKQRDQLRQEKERLYEKHANTQKLVEHFLDGDPSKNDEADKEKCFIEDLIGGLIPKRNQRQRIASYKHHLQTLARQKFPGQENFIALMSAEALEKKLVRAFKDIWSTQEITQTLWKAYLKEKSPKNIQALSEIIDEEITTIKKQMIACYTKELRPPAPPAPPAAPAAAPPATPLQRAFGVLKRDPKSNPPENGSMRGIPFKYMDNSWSFPEGEEGAPDGDQTWLRWEFPHEGDTREEVKTHNDVLKALTKELSLFLERLHFLRTQMEIWMLIKKELLGGLERSLTRMEDILTTSSTTRVVEKNIELSITASMTFEELIKKIEAYNLVSAGSDPYIKIVYGVPSKKAKTTKLRKAFSFLGVIGVTLLLLWGLSWTVCHALREELKKLRRAERDEHES